MEIFDISQEVFGCKVFPGDPSPERIVKMNMSEGSLYNLSDISMCVHNGTHIDAPYHFINDGKTVERVDLDRFIGYAYVAEHNGNIGRTDAERILSDAEKCDKRAAERILVKGDAVVTAEAARVFADAHIKLFGNESQTVGPENAPMEVHLIMLGAEIVLLEGIRPADVPAGAYLLHAAPLNLRGCDGSPCRATLIKI